MDKQKKETFDTLAGYPDHHPFKDKQGNFLDTKEIMTPAKLDNTTCFTKTQDFGTG
ncbi:MAG: hypothetical protein CM15mV89_1010 [Caudoviricetes sp.]|nr:MAG: hypothetical protein CM15mV89_1010 [Caudoviricetes sp.]